MESTNSNQFARPVDITKNPTSISTNDFGDRRDTGNPAFLGQSISRLFYKKKIEANSSSSNSSKPVLAERNAIPCSEAQTILSIPDNPTFGKISALEAFKELSKIKGSANNWELYGQFLETPLTEINKLKSQAISNKKKLLMVLHKVPVLTLISLKDAIEQVTQAKCSFVYNHKDDILSPFEAFLLYLEAIDYADIKDDSYEKTNLFLLSALMGLPQSDRRELLPLVLKGDIKAYFAECFLKVAGSDQLTLDNLLSTLKIISNSYFFDNLCKETGINPKNAPKFLPNYRVFFNDRKQALSQLLSFRDVIYLTSDIDSYLIAWALGYDDLLQKTLKELAIHKTHLKETDLYRSSVTKYLLLEKIIEKKTNLVANEVTKIFLLDSIPRAMEFIDELTGCQQLSNLTFDDIVFVNKKLSHLKFEDIKKFAEALGLSSSDIEMIQWHGNNMLYQTLSLARERGRATPANIAFALGEACLIQEIKTRLESLPCLKEVASCQLAPGSVHKYCLNENSIPETYGSVPITMEILRDLPLDNNWHLICLLLGLETEKLGNIKIYDRLAHYHWASKLSEPHRQLETGHLYLALDFLGDEYALSLFPEHLKGEPSDQSENSKRHFLWGQHLISMWKDLIKENFTTKTKDVFTIIKNLGLSFSDEIVRHWMTYFQYTPVTSIISMMFLSYRKHSLSYIVPFIKKYGSVDDIKLFEYLKEILIVKQNIDQPEPKEVASKSEHFHTKHNDLRRRMVNQFDSSKAQTNLDCRKDTPLPVDAKIKYN